MRTVEGRTPGRAGRRVAVSLAVGRWGQRLGTFTVVALALFPYAVVDAITGVPIFLATAVLWAAAGAAGFAVLLVVALWDALRSLVLRSRPSARQEAELAGAFRVGAAAVRIRPGDYRLPRERIEELAGTLGYRFAREERSYRTTLTFRSNAVPVAEEEAEIARLFAGGEPSIRIDLRGYRVPLVRIEETARRHGYELTERTNLSSGVHLRFRSRAPGRPLLRRPGLVGLALLWPVVVLGAYLLL